VTDVNDRVLLRLDSLSVAVRGHSTHLSVAGEQLLTVPGPASSDDRTLFADTVTAALFTARQTIPTATGPCRVPLAVYDHIRHLVTTVCDGTVISFDVGHPIDVPTAGRRVSIEGAGADVRLQLATSRVPQLVPSAQLFQDLRDR
jgi:hypothetical protein